VSLTGNRIELLNVSSFLRRLAEGTLIEYLQGPWYVSIFVG